MPISCWYTGFQPPPLPNNTTKSVGLIPQSEGSHPLFILIKKYISEIGFLIGNKVREDFELKIRSIMLEEDYELLIYV